MGKSRTILVLWMAAVATAQAASLRTRLLGNLPLRFEASQGEAVFTARGPNFSLSLARDQNWLEWKDGSSGRTAQVRTRLIHSNPSARMEAEGRFPAPTNYFIGPREAWRTGVAGFGRVRYRDVYPGIDLVFYGDGGRLEYDFVLAPHADPGAIQLDLSGHRTADLGDDGDLVISTPAGEVRWKRPEIYQEVAGVRQPISGRFVLDHGRTVRFEVGRFDRSRTLVIDPALKYSTYIGGKGNDSARGIAVDGAGNVYVAGASSSSELPTLSAYQPNFGGGSAGPLTGDGFVAKFSPAGALLYLTFLGGGQDDGLTSIAVDAAGNAYVTGATNSNDFPVVNAFQSQFGGFGGSSLRPGDAIVAKLDPTGSKLLYSTYLGGNRDDIGLAIAVDSAGNAYVTGATSSFNFPVTTGAFQSRFAGVGGEPIRHPTDAAPLFEPGDAFITKLDPTGSKLVFSTYLGGFQDDAALAIAIDSASNVYVGGCTISAAFPTTPGALQTTFRGSEVQNFFFNTGDAFISKLNSTGTALIYSTYFGGAGDECVNGIAVDATGNLYMAGATTTIDLPTTTGAFQRTYHGYNRLPFLIAQDFGDGFVGKLDPTGSKLLYLSYLGGRNNDAATSIAIDNQGNAYVLGFTDSTDFPVTSGALQNQLAGDGGLGLYLFYGDAFLSVVNPTGTALLYSSYFGGNADERPFGVTVDPSGNVYVVGNTVSTNLPVTANALQKSYAGMDGHVPGSMHGDAFYSVFSGLLAPPPPPPPPPPSPAITSVANAEGGATIVAANTWTEIKGTLLSTTTRTWGGADFVNNQLPTALDGVSVTIGGKKAFVYYISPTQIDVLTPPDLGTGTMQVVVQNGSMTSVPFAAQAQALSPSFFVINGGPYIVATHADYTVVGPPAIIPGTTPAAPGETIVLYANGFGATTVAVVSGALTQSGSLANLPVVTIGGASATVAFAGLVSPGLFQFNVTVPSSISNGDNGITASYGGQTTQSGALITIQR